MRRRRRHDGKKGRTFGAALVLALAAALLALSGPRLLAGISGIPGDALKARLFERPAPALGPDELEVWSESRLVALRFVEDGALYDDLALNGFYRGRLTSGADRNAYMEGARRAALAGLKLNPTDGYLWMKLALIEQRLGARAEISLEATRRSILAAPYEPNLLQNRIAVVFRNWEAADPELRNLTAEQISYLAPSRAWNAIETLATIYPERIGELRANAGDLPKIERLINRGERRATDAGRGSSDLVLE